MQCSWKGICLLALISFAAQYTVIWKLKNQSNSEGVAAGSRGCDDANSSLNATRKTHVLILAATRTGSSFFGQLFNQHPDVFFLYEPLYHIHKTLAPQIPQIRTAADRFALLGAFRDFLRSLFSCDLYSLENYIKPTPRAHVTSRLFRRGTSRVLCHQPVCGAFGPADVDVGEKDCERKCGPLNLTLANQACQKLKNVVLKTVRAVDIRNVQALVEDPRLNIKVIQLVRDPRGVLSSRISAFQGSYHQWSTWKQTGQKPNNLDLGPITSICEDFTKSVSTFLSHPEWLRGKYMLVRYEDLSKNPYPKTKEIFDFLGLSLDKDLEDWIIKHTQSNDTAETRKVYGTVRDSEAILESWRLKLSYEVVKFTQTICQKTLQQLGYKSVKSAEELRNMSVSLVEDKTFLPFL